jgi:hypothetical protein
MDKMPKYLAYLSLCCFLSCHREEGRDYIEFSGVSYDEDTGYILHQEPWNSEVEFNANLVGVMVYYGIACKYEEGEVFILSKDTFDMNLLWNVTHKARDPEWLRSHLMIEHSGNESEY